MSTLALLVILLLVLVGAHAVAGLYCRPALSDPVVAGLTDLAALAAVVAVVVSVGQR
ncbi:hypothetical protein [Streptomyces sp. NPDC005012]|uniref:hypothetical protein n=1 Tax=unclassified Streptomyces TaxID=2593676 RepID=UPI0033A648F7